MTSKTSYTLCTSTPLKNSQNLRILDSKLMKNLYLARQKLVIIIDELMRTAKENSSDKQTINPFYLTVEHYQDAIWASKILKEANEIFNNKGCTGPFKKHININHIRLENEHVKINKFGQIYIDTSILVQLIELQNLLDDTITNIYNIPSDGNTTNDSSSCTKTDYSYGNEKYDDEKINKADKSNLIIKLQNTDYGETSALKIKLPKEGNDKKIQPTKLTKLNEKQMKKEAADETLLSTKHRLQKEFLVMSAHTLKSKKSQESIGLCDCTPRQCYPVFEERMSNSRINVNDSVHSFRKARSSVQLASNNNGLKVTTADGARDIIVKCMSDLDKVKTFLETHRVDIGVTAEFQVQNQNRDQQTSRASFKHQSRCSCHTHTSGGPSEKNSKIIICIKGKEETEKDVQIIIKKCSECDSSCSDTMGSFNPCSTPGDTPCNIPCDVPCKSTCTSSCGVPCDVPCEVPCDVPCQKKSGLNIMFDPDDLTKSVITGKNGGRDISTSPRSVESDGEQCDRINLYETTNLCVTTEDGQDFIISLTVKPKIDKLPPISLKDIFSESATTTNNNRSGRVSRTGRTSRHSKVTINRLEEVNSIIVEDDRIIPLKRTKICSSLELNASTLNTRMRNKGIKHLNPNIVVRLQELGVSNLLRACRPVKCARQAVLNETLRKSLPYAASLTSLPLEETDADIIKQSLQISLNKSKDMKDHMNKVEYFSQLSNKVSYTNNVQIRFIQILQPRILFPNVQSSNNTFVVKKLSFYINLVHDIENKYKKRIHEVRIFEVKSYQNYKTLQSSTNTLQSKKFLMRPNRELKANSAEKTKTNITERIIKKKPGQEVKVKTTENTSGSSSTINSFPKQSFKYNSNKHSNYNTSRQLESNQSSSGVKTRYFTNEARQKNSKIPIYIRHKHLTRNESLECESDIYEVSTHSLPREENNIIEESEANNNLPVNIGDEVTEMILWKKPDDKMLIQTPPNENCDLEPKPVEVSDKQVIGNSTEANIRSKVSEDSFELYFNNYFYDTYLSKPTLHQQQSCARFFKQRKKKSEFIVTKSRSEIFGNASKQSIEYISITTDHNIRKNEKMKFENDAVSKIKFNNLFDGDLKISKSALQYATKVFYEYLLNDALVSENKDTILQFKDSLSLCTETVKNKCFNEIMSSLKQRIVEGSIKDTFRLLSQPNVEAGMDEQDISVEIQVTRINSISQEINGKPLVTSYLENHIERHRFLSPTVKTQHSVQTILICGPNKSCQTISIINVTEMNYHLDTDIDVPFTDSHSCDKFDTFIVLFENKSSTSLLSGDLSSENGIDDFVKCSLENDCSITGIRTFLNTDYELLTKLMETSWERMGLEPIEYFVYQNCNCHCMKPETFMDKLRAKSKFCFQSCKDRVIVKYKNNKCRRGSFEDSSFLICQKCGCYISTSPPKKKLNLTNYCSCIRPKQDSICSSQCPPHAFLNQHKHHDVTTKRSEHHDKHQETAKRNSLRVSMARDESIKRNSTKTAPFSQMFDSTIEPKEETNYGYHEKSVKETSILFSASSSSQSLDDEYQPDETVKGAKSIRRSNTTHQSDPGHPLKLCGCCMPPPTPTGCRCTYKEPKVSCTTRLKSTIDKCSASLKRLPCMSTKKVGNEFCLCRDTKNVGVRCFPDYVDVGVCTNLPKAKKPDSYLEKQDKYVGTKTSCRELGLQCLCPNRNQKSVVCEVPAFKDASTTPPKELNEDHNKSSISPPKSETDNTGFHSTIEDDVEEDQKESQPKMFSSQ